MIRKLLTPLFAPLQWCTSASTVGGSWRAHNEDFVRVETRAGEAIALLADGVGGHNAGEVASHFVCENLAQWFANEFTAVSVGSARQQLRAAIDATHEALYQQALNTPGHEDMATTLALALQVGRKALVAWAGDSRIYRTQQGTLTQLSVDHSLVEEKVQQGVLSRAEARQHPLASVITSFIGAQPAIARLDMATVTLQPDDYLLLVSDGVSSVLDITQMQALLSEGAAALVAAALAAGSRDNCSAVVVQTKLVPDADPV